MDFENIGMQNSSDVDPDRNLEFFWIQIFILHADPDPGGKNLQKFPQNCLRLALTNLKKFNLDFQNFNM